MYNLFLSLVNIGVYQREQLIAKPAIPFQHNSQFSLLHRTVKAIAERIEATREAIGEEADIIVEMHCSTNLQSAIQVAKAVEPYDIMYLEEPVDPLLPETTKKLSESTSIPLTTGERTYLRSGFLPFLQARSLSMIQPDIGICGGITEGKKIADMAYTYHVGVQAHVCGTPNHHWHSCPAVLLRLFCCWQCPSCG